jgi:hypothetical protein
MEEELEKKLNEKAYVNYQLLINLSSIRQQLEEIKNINLTNYEVNRAILERLEKNQKQKEEKEGIFR